ncbi:MAG: TolC family protein [Vulcanimicrobiota bacterium]
MFSNRLFMGRLVLWTFLLFLPFVSGPSLAQEITGPAAFVESILSRHPAIHKANELVRSAEFGLKASGLQPNPTLTLSVTAGDAGEDSNALTQNLEISGQPSLRHNIAKANLESVLQQRQATRKQVIGLAYRAWLELWRSHRLLELAQLRNLLLEEMSRVAYRRFEVGEIAENEALRVELAAAQAKAALVRAEAALESARLNAALLLGVEADSDFAINPSEPIPLFTDVNLEFVLDSIEDHPEILSRLYQLQALEMGAKLIKKERAPVLGLSLYRSSLIRSHAVEQGVQLSASWPIFDWGSIRNRSEQKRAEALAFQAGIDETLLETRRAIAKTWTLLEASRRNLKILAVQAERYEELAREARVAYDVGLWSLTDVLQTEESYRQAGIQLLQTRAEVLELEIEIVESTGLNFPQHLLQEEL